eukprot:CFRG7732T1
MLAALRSTILSGRVSSKPSFMTLASRSFFHSHSQALGDTIKITFYGSDIDEETVECEEGTTVLEAAHDNDVELEGACEGTLACSTCHVIVPKEHFDALPDMEEEEEDMLDLACGLEDTSRLGCQIVLNKTHDGMRLKIPGGDDARYKIDSPVSAPAPTSSFAPTNPDTEPARNIRLNTSIRLDTAKVVDIVEFTELQDCTTQLIMCRCWQSQKFPYCDGSHGAHNIATGDNVGPLLIKVIALPGRHANNAHGEYFQYETPVKQSKCPEIYVD